MIFHPNNLFKLCVHVPKIITYSLKIVTWTIGTDLLKPFERCIKKKNRGCPKIKGGPLTLDTPYNPVYFLWKLNFRWGTAGDNSTGSEHTVDGIT